MSAGGSSVVAARLTAAFLGVTLLVFADLRTKAWAGSELRARGPRTVAGGLLRLHYQENPGASFGRRGPRPAALMILDAAMALGLVGLLLHRLLRATPGRLLAGGLVALVGGLLGNLLGRLDHGFVVDFIDVSRGRWRWPVFNVADVALAAGLLACLAGVVARRQRTAG